MGVARGLPGVASERVRGDIGGEGRPRLTSALEFDREEVGHVLLGVDVADNRRKIRTPSPHSSINIDFLAIPGRVANLPRRIEPGGNPKDQANVRKSVAAAAMVRFNLR